MYKQDWKDMKKYLRGLKDYFYLLTGVFNITIIFVRFQFIASFKDEERAELFTGFAFVVREGGSTGESSSIISRVILG